jgi:hypothetical protein
VQETRRCPDNDGVSHPDIANKQMQTVGNDYRARAYSLLTSVNDFAEFTTQGTLHIICRDVPLSLVQHGGVRTRMMILLKYGTITCTVSSPDQIAIWANRV